jgi:hypothetical protein
MGVAVRRGSGESARNYYDNDCEDDTDELATKRLRLIANGNFARHEQ